MCFCKYRQRQRRLPGVLLFLGLLGIMGCRQGVPPKAKEETAPFQFTEMASPSVDNGSLPFLYDQGERLLFSWVRTTDDGSAHLEFSALEAGRWGALETIVSGKDWFVNWADYPMVAENKGNYWSHILRKTSPDTYAYDISMNLRPSGANDWTTAKVLHTDATHTEHGFVSVIPDGDHFFVAWLDGRNTLAQSSGERGAMSLRSARVSPAGIVRDTVCLDKRICDCCQSTAAMTAQGPIVLYRDRSGEEVRDISIVRRVKGQWTAPKTVHDDAWTIAGCPVNGPRVDADGEKVAVAWFTAAQDRPRVQLAFSADSGAHFGAPITLAEGRVQGRVDVVLWKRNTAVVTWMEMDENDSTHIMLGLVSNNGNRIQKQEIALTTEVRAAGFPQLAKQGDTLYVAYTRTTGKTKSLAVLSGIR